MDPTIDFASFSQKYNFTTPQISDISNEYISQELNYECLTSALNHLSNSSAGGPDQITSLLIKDLFKKLPNALIKSLGHELHSMKCSSNGLSSRNLIPLNKGNGKKNAKIFRPITLANIFYKILTNAQKRT